MEKFAKLFEVPNIGQILVKLDHTLEGKAPEVRVFFQPKDLGVCSVAFKWDDNSDKSWEQAEAAFKRMNEKELVLIVKEQLRVVNSVTNKRSRR